MSSDSVFDRVCLFSACLPGWDVVRVIDVAVSLGFSSIEWASGPGQAIENLGTASEVRHLCDRAGLHSGGVSVQDPEVTLADPEAAAGHLSLAVSLGAPHVRLLAPRYEGGSLRRERARATAGVNSMVELGAPVGVAVLVETSPCTLAPGPDLAAALVEQHPPERAGVLYDPGNMVIEGHLAPTLAIARLGPYLRHVHVKNIGWGRRGHAWQWQRAELARGILDWHSILHTLAATDYPGLMSIDHLGGDATRARLESEHSYLRALVGDAFAPTGVPATATGGTSRSPASA